MKKILFLATLLLVAVCLLAQQQIMPVLGSPGVGSSSTTFDVGFDFRNTSGFVTDPSCCTFETASGGSLDYPVTSNINGYTNVKYGFESALSCTGGAGSTANRNATYDARLAGLAVFANSTTCSVFRVDLQGSPSSCHIGLAMGDPGGGNSQTNYVAIYDNTTSRLAFSPANSDSTHFVDASGASLTPSAWPGSNTTVSETFSSTILRVKFGGTTDSNSTTLAHLRVTCP